MSYPVLKLKFFNSFIPIGLFIWLFASIGCSTESSSHQEEVSNEPVNEDQINQLVELSKKNLYLDWEYASAKKTFDQILAMDSTLATVYADYAWYEVLKGNRESAIYYIQKAEQYEPENPQWVQWHGWICFCYDDSECTEEYLNRSLDLDPNLSDAKMVKGTSYLKKGMKEEAIKWFREAGQDSNYRSSLAFSYALEGKVDEAKKIMIEVENGFNLMDKLQLAAIYDYLDEREKAFEMLQKCYELRHPYMPWISFMPSLRSLSDDPRFHAMQDSLSVPIS